MNKILDRPNNIKFFADSADPKEIEYCVSRNVGDGITTNPKIMEIAGIKNFEIASKQILTKYPNIPVSLETDLQGIPVSKIESRAEEVKDVLLYQARTIAQWGKNVVIKIPICTGGLLAVKELVKERIKTNVTACTTPYQALTAAETGATYVSLFANRMVDGHIFEMSGYNSREIDFNNPWWKETVAANKKKYFEKAWEKTLRQVSYTMEKLEQDNPKVELIIGSIRDPQDIYKLVTTKPHIITITPKIVKGLENILTLKKAQRIFLDGEAFVGDSLSHSVTTYTLEEFEKAADTYRHK